MKYDKFCEILKKEIGYDPNWRSKGAVLIQIVKRDNFDLLQFALRLVFDYSLRNRREATFVIETLLKIEQKGWGLADIDDFIAECREIK